MIFEARRFVRTILGIILIVLGLVLRFEYKIAWADELKIKKGTASWYDYESCKKEGTNGRFTASGERFFPEDLTCASWDYKFGTMLRITNLRSGRSIIVKVNDRGPSRRLYRKGRLVDLSRGAFRRIADLHFGIIRVKVEEV